MGKLGEAHPAELLAFRVLKRYGAWEVGDIQVGQTLTMTQGLRTGMVERAPEHDHVFPIFADIADDGKVTVRGGKPYPKKAKADDAASV